MAENRDFYKVLLIGASGKGKTYSFRNLNQQRTGFINAEDKPLPFKANFKFHAKPKKFDGMMKALDDYSANPEIDVIVIDSLSAAFETLVEEAREKFTNWDVWNYYNKKISELLKKIKGIKKEVIITAHYEVLNVEGTTEKRVKAKGKEWEGVIEKEFTMVLYAEDKYKKDGIPEYSFRLMGEGLSAKCPPDIFGVGVTHIPNDTQYIVDKILEFTK